MEQSTNRDNLFIYAVLASMLAIVIATVGVGFGMRAISESKDNRGGDGGGESEPLRVRLAEFSISPAGGTVAAGSEIEVSNTGKTVHDLTVEGANLTTGSIQAGSTGRMDTTGLNPGKYTVFCSVAGHREAGMEAELTVTEGGGTAAPTGVGGHAAMSSEDMDRSMHDVVAKFPAKTKGLGGQPLEPKVLPDGTKRFELTAKITDWEIEPGKLVKAWTYNGTVPGPTIRVADGDRIEVVLKNALPESTAIHFHGLRTPNSMDGVPDITQPPIKPGETFTYAFVARGPAVGMYHSHHNAAEQVPNGLAATILVGDLPVPAGVQVTRTYPMMLNDAGVIGFSLNGKSFPATEPVAVKLNDWVLVHYLNEGVMAHPMHLHGLEQLVIAKDGMPLPQPYRADTVNVAPGERYSVLVKADEPGVWAWHCHILPHAERNTGMFGMVTAMIVK